MVPFCPAQSVTLTLNMTRTIEEGQCGAGQLLFIQALGRGRAGRKEASYGETLLQEASSEAFTSAAVGEWVKVKKTCVLVLTCRTQSVQGRGRLRMWGEWCLGKCESTLTKVGQKEGLYWGQSAHPGEAAHWKTPGWKHRFQRQVFMEAMGFHMYGITLSSNNRI